MPEKQLLAGAATTVITPTLGVSLCGSMLDQSAATIHDDLHARSLVLDNGDTKLALVVLDLIAARKEWLSEIKHQINSFTGIPLAHILISCTHTHSGPTPVPVFQSNVETNYLKWTAPRVADCVRVAVQRLQPARIGWGLGREEHVVFNRRYFMKPGTKLSSPFPGIEDKVKMNPGEMNPAIDKPAGPIDPDVAVLAVQKAENADGQPLAVFASYGLHYVGGMPGTDVSADYFGAVAAILHDLTGGPRRDARQPFVAALANACFGDINNIDVSKKLRQPYPYHQMEGVAQVVARAIYETWRTIKYRDWVSLSAREKSIELGIRKPSPAEVQAAKELLERASQGPLHLLPEIYAAGNRTTGGLARSLPYACASVPDRRSRLMFLARRAVLPNRPGHQGPQPVQADHVGRHGQRLRRLPTYGRAARPGRLRNLASQVELPRSKGSHGDSSDRPGTVGEPGKVILLKSVVRSP